MSRRAPKMGDRGHLFFAFLFLVMLPWGQLIRDRNDNKARFDPWRADPVWEHQEGGDVESLEIAGGQEGTGTEPVVVARWERARRVLDRNGNVVDSGPSQPAAADSSSCAAMVPDLEILWDSCFPGRRGGAAHSGLFLGALRYGDLYQLVVAEKGGRVQVPFGDASVEEARWTHEVPGGISALLVEDLTGDSSAEVIVASPDGAVLELDAEGSAHWTANLGEPARSLGVIEWDGDPASLEIAVGGAQGKVVVLNDQGQQVADWKYWDSPVEQLARTDFDHDGREDLAASFGMPLVEIFRHDLTSVSIPLAAPAEKLAVSDDLLVAGNGSQIKAYRLVESSWLGHYRPLLGPLLFTLVVIAVGLPVILLHPRLEYGVPSETKMSRRVR